MDHPSKQIEEIKLKLKYAPVAIGIVRHFKALNTQLRLDPRDRRRQGGGHARRRTGNRNRQTKLLRPASTFGDFLNWYDLMFFVFFLHLHHLIAWVLL